MARYADFGTRAGGDLKETQVGPELDPGNAWDTYTMTATLQANAFYAFYVTLDGETTRMTLTTFIPGSELIGLTALTTATSYNDSDDNVRSVLVPRLQSTGAFQIYLAMKDETMNELYIHMRESTYQIVKMVRFNF